MEHIQDEFISRWQEYDKHFSLSGALVSNGIHKIAIYGGGKMGVTLYERLKDSNVQIACVIDKNPELEFPYPDADIINTADIYERGFPKHYGELDAVIVSTRYLMHGICAELSNVFSCRIIHLTDIIIDYEWYEALIRAISHIKAHGAKLLMLRMDNAIFDLKNPSTVESIIAHALDSGNGIDWRRALDPGYLSGMMSYYDDIAECSLDYINEAIRICGILGTYKFIEQKPYPLLMDTAGKLLNIINGRRVVIGAPSEYNRVLWFMGGCYILGNHTEDRFTLQSSLQRMLNDKPLHNLSYRMETVPLEEDWSQAFHRICGIDSFHHGDTIVLLYSISKGDYSYYCKDATVLFYDMAPAFDRPHEFDEIFLDHLHFNHRGYHLMARKLYELLAKIETPAPDTALSSYREPADHSGISSEAIDPKIDEYIREIKHTTHGKLCAQVRSIGSVVMNCNPFTNGHRHLVEFAASQVEWLYLFVVEEDFSEFAFEDRISMVRSGTKDLENVIVIRSGQFIISAQTMSEYFVKSALKNVIIDTSYDLNLFANKIAPQLSISKRFVGEEPGDPITRQYNLEMKRILPKYGIECIELPRLAQGGAPVSASLVRRYLSEINRTENASQKETNWSLIKGLVPNATYRFLKLKFAAQ